MVSSLLALPWFHLTVLPQSSPHRSPRPLGLYFIVVFGPSQRIMFQRKWVKFSLDRFSKIASKFSGESWIFPIMFLPKFCSCFLYFKEFDVLRSHILNLLQWSDNQDPQQRNLLLKSAFLWYTTPTQRIFFNSFSFALLSHPFGERRYVLLPKLSGPCWATVL